MPTMNAPTLKEKYDLNPDTIEAYRENGHTFAPGLANVEEIAFYRQVINSAADRYGQSPDTPLASRDTYGKAFLQHKNLWEHDQTVRPFVLAERFGRVAAELMGVAAVRLYHDQALFKEPGGGFTPWHQDQYYWPIDNDHTITMWMPLVDITQDMGMLTFASGSHQTGYLGTLPISDESQDMFQRHVDEQGFTIHRETSMKAGDATFHSGWCLHSAPRKLVPNPPPSHDRHLRGRRLPGQRTGE